MKCIIAAVGRAKQDSEHQIFRQYVRQIPWQVDLVEVEEKKPLPLEKRKAREAELLLGAVPSHTLKIVLDEKGRQVSSRDFAQKLSVWMTEGYSSCAFFIGGADGHGEKILQSADFTLSFGAMTWPHMLVRAMLAEQIYRACMILGGHPYHRD